MKTLTARRDTNSFHGVALHALQHTFATVGQKARPEAFTHIQPHSHATARLARHFVTYCYGDIAGPTPTPEEIECGAYLHDIGKYFIRDSILLKPASLDEGERAVMSRHPVYGAALVSRLDAATKTIRRVVLYHHEHWDGTGYPEGMCGTSIPFEARVVSVVDVYTSLRSRRTYKPTLSKEGALKVLTEMAGRELDPYLSEDFVMWLSRISKTGRMDSPVRPDSSLYGLCD